MKRRNLALITGLAAAATVAGVVGLAIACTSAEPSSVASAEAQRVVDDRDQYELVQEIIAARKNENLVPALDKVRGAWQGRHYTWEVGLLPALCRSASSCVAMPFDHLKHDDLKIVQGWLPRIDLDEQTHERLLADCKAHAQCVFTFEGRLDRFVLNPEDPTSLGFSGVTIASTRAATGAESWIRRPRNKSAHRFDPNVVGLRTQPRAGGQSR